MAHPQPVNMDLDPGGQGQQVAQAQQQSAQAALRACGAVDLQRSDIAPHQQFGAPTTICEWSAPSAVFGTADKLG